MKFKKRNALKKHLNDQDVALYVDALLKDDISGLSDMVLTQVENCPSCKDEILDVFLTLKNTGSTKRLTPLKTIIPPEDKKIIRQPPYRLISRIAASFFMLALLLTFYFSVVHPHFFQKTEKSLALSTSSSKPATQEEQNEPEFQSEIKSISQKGSKNDSALKKIQNTQKPNFKINPNLEFMVNSQFRNETIKVNSPVNKATFRGKILFAWESFSPSSIQLKILNNKNDIIYQYTLNQSEFVLKEKLSPGVYYWKLESHTDLLYVGKFFIK